VKIPARRPEKLSGRDADDAVECRPEAPALTV
jgi:hypothetical protein